MVDKLQIENHMKGPAGAVNCCSHMSCLHVKWHLVLDIQKHLDLKVQDKVLKGMQGRGSRCNLNHQQLQLGKALKPHQVQQSKTERWSSEASLLDQWQNWCPSIPGKQEYNVQVKYVHMRNGLVSNLDLFHTAADFLQASPEETHYVAVTGRKSAVETFLVYVQH